MKRRKHTGDLVTFGAALILVAIMLCSGFQILESTVFSQPAVAASDDHRKTIVRSGTEYFPRQDMTVVMVLGIDQYGPVAPSESYTNHGSADLVMLLIFDETNEICNVLHLNRDTMLEMPVLGIGGREAGTLYGQLALSHTYGSGMEDSCENTRTAVSDLLYGIQIDHYVAMNMDAISILNDAVGGVTVNVTEDFSRVDPTIGQGRVTLMGQQSVNFVRTRKGLGDQLNLTRMERHREYIDGFAEAFRARQEQQSDFIVQAYQEVSDYMVTDCSVNVISGMIDRYGDYEISEVVSPEGENVMGEEYFEFYLDEEKMDALILRLFYAPKK